MHSKNRSEQILAYLIASTVHTDEVRAWTETIVLPTYELGEQERYPMFLEKRVYQGSSGVVYPYAVTEKVSDVKTDKSYLAMFIENRYIKVLVLPELGGRIQMAYDKIRKRHFVYYNQVIKPALVGLTGPWISGGIEFNWPQHHRPSTMLPTDYHIEEHADGSKTLWCNEVERMFRTKGMQGFTLQPDTAYLEIKATVYNRTPYAQTFLWWANPAIPANDHYQSVFPPDVHAVFDHGKRDVSTFPIATGVYYKQDYSKGVDISMYKNIPVPTSYMAIRSSYDFIGGYDYSEKAGILHVANHHVSPGKKQWTWGNGDFGKAWDRNLTDEDGPYIELMTGVYTDNQPDFAWLQPYEEKSWTQYFMPYAEAGYVKNANKQAAVNLEVVEGKVKVVLYTTAVWESLKLTLSTESGNILFEKSSSCRPEEPLLIEWPLGSYQADELMLKVETPEGKTLISCRYREHTAQEPIPEAAKTPADPLDVETVEQLYLIGLHLEQYRHATYNPLDYYREGLRRHPTDIRCNNALGLYLLRRGKYQEAESYFMTAIDAMTVFNPNPYDGQVHYNLGSSLLLQKRLAEAYTAFYKAIWNEAWRSAGYFSLAAIDCMNEQWDIALEHLNKGLITNAHHHKARQLKASVLRKLGAVEEARAHIQESLAIDPFNVGCLFEKFLLLNDKDGLDDMKQGLRGSAHDALEFALDFAYAGFYTEAIALLDHWSEQEEPYPMTYYARGYFLHCQGKTAAASDAFKQAANIVSYGCFPNRVEEVTFLQQAIQYHSEDASAYTYLGNFWYANKQYEDAITCWERAAVLDEHAALVWRNLAIGYFNKQNEQQKALQCMEKAFSLERADARLFMELDQLYKRLNKPYAFRLALYNQYIDLIHERDDLYVEWVTLHNLSGQFEKAKALMSAHRFHPWEGGEGKITKQYEICHLALASAAIQHEDFETAQLLLQETDRYPENLGEGKLATKDENDINYYKGVVHVGLGEQAIGQGYFQKATAGPEEPAQAIFYNDTQPDTIYFKALAYLELGDRERATNYFHMLITYGEEHMNDACRIDYFAVSLPDLAIWDVDLGERNKAHCNYVIALGYAGLGSREKAADFLDAAKRYNLYGNYIKLS